MWTTGIAPLCSSGFVIDKIVLDRVMPQFKLCCTVFTLQLSSLSELVGVTDPKSSLLLLLPLPTGIVIYSCLLQSSAFGYSIPHILLPLFLHILWFRQRQVLFPCLLCIMNLCTHFILLLTVIFIFTLSTELQMSLSLSFSDCESKVRSSEYVKCL